MQDILQPILHKTPLIGLCRGINRSGLSIGDTAKLLPTAEGGIEVAAQMRRRFLLVSRRQLCVIGQLGPAATRLVAPLLARSETLRVRIVGITPEHLAPDGRAEVHVSVWGHIRVPPPLRRGAAGFGSGERAK
ncbi:MAG: hypothetical protein ACK4GW_00575 [Pseudorhodobacter sp.]